jgi:hypothetical protein
MWQLHMCILFNQEMITGHWALVLRMSILSGCRMLSPVTGTSRPRWSMSNGHRTDVGTSGHVTDLPEGRSICAYKPSGQPQIAACKTPNTHSHPTALFNQYLILYRILGRRCTIASDIHICHRNCNAGPQNHRYLLWLLVWLPL